MGPLANGVVALGKVPAGLQIHVDIPEVGSAQRRCHLSSRFLFVMWKCTWLHFVSAVLNWSVVATYCDRIPRSSMAKCFCGSIEASDLTQILFTDA